jgi:hypothetical protein
MQTELQRRLEWDLALYVFGGCLESGVRRSVSSLCVWQKLAIVSVKVFSQLIYIKICFTNVALSMRFEKLMLL